MFGRCLRKNSGKEMSYVLVPLVSSSDTKNKLKLQNIIYSIKNEDDRIVRLKTSSLKDKTTLRCEIIGVNKVDIIESIDNVVPDNIKVLTINSNELINKSAIKSEGAITDSNIGENNKIIKPTLNKNEETIKTAKRRLIKKPKTFTTPCGKIYNKYISYKIHTYRCITCSPEKFKLTEEEIEQVINNKKNIFAKNENYIADKKHIVKNKPVVNNFKVLANIKDIVISNIVWDINNVVTTISTSIYVNTPTFCNILMNNIKNDTFLVYNDNVNYTSDSTSIYNYIIEQILHIIDEYLKSDNNSLTVSNIKNLKIYTLRLSKKQEPEYSDAIRKIKDSLINGRGTIKTHFKDLMGKSFELEK